MKLQLFVVQFETVDGQYGGDVVPCFLTVPPHLQHECL